MPTVNKLRQTFACRCVIELDRENFSQIPEFNFGASTVETTMPRQQVLVFLCCLCGLSAPEVTGSCKVCIDLKLHDWLEWFHSCVECSHVEIFTRFEEHIWLGL